MKYLQNFKEILTNFAIILNDYDLCDNCLGRLSSKNSDISYTKFGKKIRIMLNKQPCKKCYICKNIFKNITYYITKLIKISLDYEFTTFLLGFILKLSALDNDDDIKSKFHLYGTSSLKFSINKEFTKSFSKLTKTNVDIFSPDMLFIINLRNNTYTIKSKPIFISGKYIKKTRKLFQKQIKCKKCHKIYCACICPNHESHDYIETKITKYLNTKFNTNKFKIIFSGGEDNSSLVVGTGRSFFVKIIDPKIRHIDFETITDDNLLIYDLKFIKQFPHIVNFKSKIKIDITTKYDLSHDFLKQLCNIKKISFLNYNNKLQIKPIYNMQCIQLNDNLFSMILIVDNGFPIKKFIDHESVTPTINTLLQNKCTSIYIDFYEIIY